MCCMSWTRRSAPSIVSIVSNKRYNVYQAIDACMNKYLVVYFYQCVASGCVLYIVLQLLQHMEKFLLPGPLFLLNGKQVNIIILHQPKFSNASDLSCISSVMRGHMSPSIQSRIIEMDAHSMINSNETELVPISWDNRAIQTPVKSAQVIPIETSRELDIQSDYQYMLCNFPFHHHSVVPGSNPMQGDITLNLNSEKQFCENVID